MGKALDDLIAGFGKTTESKHTRDCAAIGCFERVFGYALFCPECWRKCPSDLRKLIEKHHRPGKRESKVLMKWIQQAIEELLFLRTEGHYSPRATSFMWDDAPAAASETSDALFEAPDATPKT